MTTEPTDISQITYATSPLPDTPRIRAAMMLLRKLLNVTNALAIALQSDLRAN